MKRKSFIILIIFLIIVAVVFVLYKTHKPTKKSVVEQKIINVAYGQYVSPIFVAYDKGLFEKRNLKVQMQLIPDTTAITQGISTGEIDVASLPYSVLFDFEKASPGNFKIFGNIVETIDNPYSFLIVKDNIKSVKDLKGKKIVIRTGINSKIQSEMILKSLNINPDSVEFIQVQPSLTAPTFAKPEISAAIDIEPSATAIIQKDLGKILIAGVRAKYIVNPYPTTAQIFSNKFVSSNPADAEKFRSALEEAIDYMRTNDQDSRAILQKWLKLDADVASKMYPSIYEKFDEIDKGAIDTLMNIEVEHKVLPDKLNLENVYYKIP